MFNFNKLDFVEVQVKFNESALFDNQSGKSLHLLIAIIKSRYFSITKLRLNSASLTKNVSCKFMHVRKKLP